MKSRADFIHEWITQFEPTLTKRVFATAAVRFRDVINHFVSARTLSRDVGRYTSSNDTGWMDRHMVRWRTYSSIQRVGPNSANLSTVIPTIFPRNCPDWRRKGLEFPKPDDACVSDFGVFFLSRSRPLKIHPQRGNYVWMDWCLAFSG